MQNNDDLFDSGNEFIGFLKLAIFIAAPLFLFFYAKNFIFSAIESTSSLSLELSILFVLLGIIGFMTVIMWILLIYNEVTIGKLKAMDKKIELIRRNLLDK